MSTVDASELRCTWELPYVAIYLRTFSGPFDVPYYESETLEELLISPTGLEKLEGLALKLLTPFIRRKGEEYDDVMKKEVARRYPECDEMEYLQDHKFAELTARQKLSVLRLLCDMRLEEAGDVRACLEGIEADLLRHEDIGEDKDKAKYYYFQDSRLWREAKAKKSRAKSGKREREDPAWELMCSNAEEWAVFASKLNKRRKDEKNLREVIEDELMPEIREKEELRIKAAEARIRAEARRLKWDAMPRRVSRRVKEKMEEEERLAELEAEEEALRVQAAELARIERENNRKLERSRERRYRERIGHSPTPAQSVTGHDIRTRAHHDNQTASEDHLSNDSGPHSPSNSEDDVTSPRSATLTSLSQDSEIAGTVHMGPAASNVLENRPSIRIHLKLHPREPDETTHPAEDTIQAESESGDTASESKGSDMDTT